MKRVFFSTFFVLLILTSCAKENIVGDESTDIVFPLDSTISYSRHIEPLFQQRCAFSGCHGGSQPAAGLNLTTPSYNSLMNHQPRLVVAGEPNNSYLIQRLDGTLPPRMPFNATPLTQNQLDGIKKWISEGTENN
jgi:hypothetical protein